MHILLTKRLIRMGEEERINCQEYEEDPICDQIQAEEGRAISAQFVLQQTLHHWMS